MALAFLGHLCMGRSGNLALRLLADDDTTIVRAAARRSPCRGPTGMARPLSPSLEADEFDHAMMERAVELRGKRPTWERFPSGP